MLLERTSMPKNLCHHTKDVLIQFIYIFFAIHFGSFLHSIHLRLCVDYFESVQWIFSHAEFEQGGCNLAFVNSSILSQLNNRCFDLEMDIQRKWYEQYVNLAHFLRSIVDNRQINRANDFCGVIRKSLPLFSLPLSLSLDKMHRREKSAKPNKVWWIMWVYVLHVHIRYLYVFVCCFIAVEYSSSKWWTVC